MGLTDKVAIVTGGSRGIGAATCVALAAEGARVAVNYQASAERAQQVVEMIIGKGGDAFAVAADVTQPDQVAELVSRTQERWGRLDILVNNAGVSNDTLIYTMTAEDWQSVMAVNFGGMFNCTKAVLDTFMGQRSGTIVNVSSVMAERGWVGQANYAASKGAINAFTRTAAVELARFGIRVNAVLPGFSPTDLVAGLVDKGGKGIKRQLPMRAFGDVDEVAGAIVFLAGQESSYVTGSCLTVDGGASAQLGLGKPD